MYCFLYSYGPQSRPRTDAGFGLLPHFLRHHATEADMIRPAVRSAFPACPDFVRRAVLVRTQVRAAAHHTLGRAGFAGIVTVARTLWIPGRLSRSGEFPVVITPVPLGTPLPDVAGHVV